MWICACIYGEDNNRLAREVLGELVDPFVAQRHLPVVLRGDFLPEHRLPGVDLEPNAFL